MSQFEIQNHDLGDIIPTANDRKVPVYLNSNSVPPSKNNQFEPVPPLSIENSGSDSDGGYGWFIVVASFLSLFVQFGITYSYGVFLTHYIKQYEGRATIATLSCLGTVCTSVAMFGAVISGKIADRVGYRNSIWAGGVIFSSGLLLASFAKEVWVLFLTQGVMMGLGGSAIFIPALSAPSQWFTRRRGLATGIASTGSGLGGLALAPLIEITIQKTSVQQTLQYLSGFTLVIYIVSGFFIRNRVTPPSKAWIDWRLFLNPHFRSFFIGEMIFALGYIVPIILLTTYAQEIKIDKVQAALTLGLLNGGSAFGRILLGLLSDIIGPLNVLIMCGILTSLSTLLIWPFCNDLASLIVYAIVYGVASGGFVALIPVALARIFGTTNLASTTGMIYFGSSIPVLIGTPIASQLLSATSNSEHKIFQPTIYYVGSILLLAALCFVYLRFRLYPTLLKKI